MTEILLLEIYSAISEPPLLLFVSNAGSYSSELVDMSGKNLTCVDPPSMSFADGGISSLKTLDGNPLACGGQPSYHHCYEYDPARMEWIDGPCLSQEMK